MRKLIVLLVLAMAMVTVADILMLEDFEDATVTYTPSVPEFTDGVGDYFTRVSAGTRFLGVTGQGGSDWFGAEDIDGTGSPLTLDWTGINITGYSSLQFSGLFAEDDDGGNQDWDGTDYLHITYQIDGGGYNNLLAFENATGLTNEEPGEDTDFDGNADGTMLNETFTLFTKSIAGTGNTLDLQISIALNAGDEDIQFDDIQVTGVIPEPTTLALFGLAVGIMAILRRRK